MMNLPLIVDFVPEVTINICGHVHNPKTYQCNALIYNDHHLL
jgi:hypothetical protein